MASPHLAQHSPAISRTLIPTMHSGNSRAWLLAGFEEAESQVKVSRGTTLFIEGQSPTHVMVVNSGLIKLSIVSREGRKIIVRVAGPGSVLGLNAALASRSHEFTAEVVENASLRVIPLQEFVSQLRTYPTAAMAAVSLLLKEYDAVFSNIRRFALPATVTGRLASLLLSWLEERRLHGHKGSRIIVSLKHEEIACMIGTSRETVNRVLQQFRREKLIDIKGSWLTILREGVLEQLAT